MDREKFNLIVGSTSFELLKFLSKFEKFFKLIISATDIPITLFW